MPHDLFFTGAGLKWPNTAGQYRFVQWSIGRHWHTYRQSNQIPMTNQWARRDTRTLLSLWLNGYEHGLKEKWKEYCYGHGKESIFVLGQKYTRGQSADCTEPVHANLTQTAHHGLNLISKRFCQNFRRNKNFACILLHELTLISKFDPASLLQIRFESDTLWPFLLQEKSINQALVLLSTCGS